MRRRTYRAPWIAAGLSIVSVLACSACGTTVSGTQSGAGETTAT